MDLSKYETLGVLARHPSMFKDTGDVERLPTQEEHTMTNKGLRIQLPVIRDIQSNIAAILNCATVTSESPLNPLTYIGIPLRHTAKRGHSSGRSPDESLLPIAQFEKNYAEVQTVFLQKVGTTRVDPELELVGEHGKEIMLDDASARLCGFRLRSALRAVLPLTKFTTYDSLDVESGRFEFPYKQQLRLPIDGLGVRVGTLREFPGRR